ncbi:hypothetical protein AURDEDRAFT_121983 [Auricularia subglabra TFB-10046 SS5]|nr:hypothetical protein AURDEDRAFT_121983 [Auricularia subglabra TFB-10046 SS5]
MAHIFNMYFKSAAVYVDRTVFPRAADREQKCALMNGLAVLGASTVYDALDSHIVLVDPARTVIDNSFDDVRAMIVDYAYIAACIHKGAAIPIAEYLVRDGAPLELNDEMLAVDNAVLTTFHKQAPNDGTRSASLPDDETTGMNRSARMGTRGAPPLPSCNFATFEDAGPRNWALDFVCWYLPRCATLYETPFVLEVSKQMAKIVDDLHKTTFFNTFRRDRSLKKDVCAVLEECKEQRGKNILSAEEMDGLLQEAAASFKRSLGGNRPRAMRTHHSLYHESIAPKGRESASRMRLNVTMQY